MTPSELIINFVIGIVTGLATGAFFAARTKPDDLSIDDFVFRNYAWRHHATLTINVRCKPSLNLLQVIARRLKLQGYLFWYFWLWQFQLQYLPITSNKSYLLVGF